MGSLVELLAVFMATFGSPFVIADEPIALPLPQEVDYAQYMRLHLQEANFSTDPTLQPRVAAETDEPAVLEAFIVNYEACVVAQDVVAYRLVVRNSGEQAATGVVAQFKYPAGVLQYNQAHTAPPRAIAVNEGAGIVEWAIDTIEPGPGFWHEANITFTARSGAPNLPTELTVLSGTQAVLTSHVIPQQCLGVPAFPERPLPAKQPVIICDPAESSCIDEVPTNLGPNFTQVLNDPQRHPTICSPNDPRGCTPNMPILGPRFSEAVVSILPGECSVVEDNIVAQPEFHDGFLRRAEPAAYFLKPLHESERDFTQLVHKNELLGITHMIHARDILSRIHHDHWHERLPILRSVLDGGISTDQIRAEIDGWHIQWTKETRTAQKDLSDRYRDLQNTRDQTFDPIGQQAITNARDSIDRACNQEGNDGGVGTLLFGDPANPSAGSVKRDYLAALDEREAAYDDTQDMFANSNKWPPEYRPEASWKKELRDALNAYDSGDKKPLQNFIATLPTRERAGFEALWNFTYAKHAADDRAADDIVRRSKWEIALDTPKSVATACARDTDIAARVEVSWCESGIYPEFIIREAPTPARQQEIAPPALLSGGENAIINPQLTIGVSCGGRPGDPFWAADCSCNCYQLVPGRDGNILFCQAGKELQPDPQPPGVPSTPAPPVIRPPIDFSPPPTASPTTSFPPGPQPSATATPPVIRPGPIIMPPIFPYPYPTILPSFTPTPSPSPTASPSPSVGPITTCTTNLDCTSVVAPWCVDGLCSTNPAPQRRTADPGFAAQQRPWFFPPETPGTPPGIPSSQSGSGIKPIIRHDVYTQALGPITQAECLQELPYDDHLLVNYP